MLNEQPIDSQFFNLREQLIIPLADLILFLLQLLLEIFLILLSLLQELLHLHVFFQLILKFLLFGLLPSESRLQGLFLLADFILLVLQVHLGICDFLLECLQVVSLFLLFRFQLILELCQVILLSRFLGLQLFLLIDQTLFQRDLPVFHFLDLILLLIEFQNLVLDLELLLLA
jgi:hypothetical protein